MNITLLLAVLLSSSCALELIGNYQHGPINLSSVASLYYRVDKSSDIVHLGLVLNDSVIGPGAFWMGIGIGEPTSGSMLGADIITAEMSINETGSCSITDRYVPFVPYPLREPPGPFPLPDDCEEPDWTLISCIRDSNGSAILEVQRPLSVKDPKQDRQILPGHSAVLYAYGDVFGYHGENRHSARIVLFNEDDTSPSDPELPDDVDGFVDLRATNYSVPNSTTTYACTSTKVPLPSEGKRMVVAVDPLVNNSMIHHFTLYLCSGSEYAEETKNTTNCGSVEPYGPLDAKGTGRAVFPADVGIALGSTKQYLVMETHFDNPTMENGRVDTSGLRVYYTDRMRKHEAGSLLLGDSFVARNGETVETGVSYQHSCPSACTSRMSEPINIFASLLHMHTTGKTIHTNIYSSNNTFVRNLNKPGQQLQTVCEYDTSKRPGTKFGLSTLDEMCMDFVLYWPLQKDEQTGHEINLCTFYQDDSMENSDAFTVCAENGRVEEFFENPSIFPQSKNPAFNDTVGAPTEFASTGAQCLPDSSLGSSEPESSTETESSPLDTSEPEALCFPASATATLKDGRQKRMDCLRIGDEVAVGNGLYSKVFLFTHSQKKPCHNFIHILTENNFSVTLTAGHYLYISDKIRPARSATSGEFVKLGDGRKSKIINVSTKKECGLFNPQTVHGDIVVGGIVTSTYTETIPPVIAHSLLAPIRLISKLLFLFRGSIL